MQTNFYLILVVYIMRAFHKISGFTRQQKCFFSFLFFFFISYQVNIAQNFERFDYLPVSENGNQLYYPWTGGLNSIQLGKADVNHDGKKDLVVYDKSNQKYCVFLTLTTNSTHYKFEASYATHFPEISGWMVIKDYNCDGIEDIFTYNGEGNIRVFTGFYRNDTLNFKLQQDGFYYIGSGAPINVYCADVLKPAIVDVNLDGDLDIISFDVFGTRLIYYENQQKELSLPCDSLFFNKTDNCFGNVRDSFSSIYALRDTCNFKFNRIGENNEIQHTGSTIDAIDADNNGAIDVLIGSVSISTITMLYNNGNPSYASILDQDTHYPSTNTAYNTNSFASPVFIDVDNDNKRDLIVSTYDNGASNVNNIWYYKNSKINKLDLTLQQKNFLLDNMIDAGENSIPCFYDVDGDGLKDMLIGSGGFRDNTNTVYKLLYYKNAGTTDYPKYVLQNDDFLNVSTFGIKDLAPAAGDIDNDGDADLLVGMLEGKIIYWENTAATGNPPNLVFRTFLKDSSNAQISIGANSTPLIIDLDKDGKNDLIIGERNGNINFYKGNSSTAAKFSFTTDSIGKIRIRSNVSSFGYTHASIADVNNDGKLDLILGTNQSGLLFYDNVEENWNNVMTTASTIVPDYLGLRTSACIDDITGDGKLELLTGSTDGGLIIFSQDAPPFQPTEVQYNNSTLKLNVNIYPNPTNNLLNIVLQQQKKDVSIALFNVLGEQLSFTTYHQKSNIELSTSTLSNGIYLLKISDGEKESIVKVIVQH